MSGSPLPEMFWEAGPRRIQLGFAQLLQRRIDAGQLDIADVQRAAAQFFTLVKGDVHARLLLGCDDVVDAAAVERHLAA